MKQPKTKITMKHYKIYLISMLVACGGAFVWQFFLPNLSGQFISRESSIGWQREIVLWNIGIIGAIIAALIKESLEYMKILTFQPVVLCLLLGLNHLISLLQNFFLAYMIHILGTFGVLLLGGIRGSILLSRSNQSTEQGTTTFTIAVRRVPQFVSLYAKKATCRLKLQHVAFLCPTRKNFMAIAPPSGPQHSRCAALR